MRRSPANWVKLLPLLLISVGLGLIAVALAADLVGVGDRKGLGPRQITLALGGFAMLLSGSVLATSPGQRYLKVLFTVDAPPASIPLIAAWFGLITGWIEALVFAVRVFALYGIINLGVDYLWMAPLANASLFVCVGLVLSLVARRWPELGSLQSATLLLALLAYLSLLLLFSQLHGLAALLLAAGLATQTARIVSGNPRGFYRLVRYTTGWPAMLIKLARANDARASAKGADVGVQLTRREFLLGAGATIATVAVGVHAREWLVEERELRRLPPRPSSAPNVLLIVLDTVRAQSLSLHGYTRPTTPQLRRLAQSGVCFERAVSTSPWTLPSHASMFTGHFPHELSADWGSPLNRAYPTLAETLGEHGYVTAGFTANTVYCGRQWGLNRGFAHYEDHPVSPGRVCRSASLLRNIAEGNWFRRIMGTDWVLGHKAATDVNRDFLRWLSRRDRRPFFVFLNYFDAHEPYLSPEPFREMFRSNAQRRNHLIVPKWRWSTQEIQAEMDAYDASIAYTDHALGQILDELEKRGVLDNTLVIITSDHGEEFGGHRVFAHGFSLYLPSLYVPLLILFPSHVPRGAGVRDPVTLCDLPATIMDLLGFDHEAAFPGSSLARYWDDTRSPAGPTASMLLSEVNHGPVGQEWYPIAKGDMKSLLDDRYHYIQNGDGSEELYDFQKDPWEKRDLADSGDGRRMVEQFRASLDMVLARSQP